MFETVLATATTRPYTWDADSVKLRNTVCVLTQSATCTSLLYKHGSRQLARTVTNAYLVRTNCFVLATVATTQALC
jgi:hypothetical protein